MGKIFKVNLIALTLLNLTSQSLADENLENFVEPNNEYVEEHSKISEINNNKIKTESKIEVKADKTQNNNLDNDFIDKINKSNYIYDYDIDYNLTTQYNALKEKLLDSNIPKQDKKTIEANLEQLSDLIDYLNTTNDKFIIVNIPSYHLVAFNNDNTIGLESKVIIGGINKRTPLNSINILSLKYNPTWTPTPNMVNKNVFKNGSLNINYLKSHGLKAYQNGRVVSYNDLDYAEDYQFIQPSGLNNSLGVLKFETDSNANIYLHDTNEAGLFKNKNRAKSSGCVRVQNYVDLASWLSFGDNKNHEYIKNEINKQKTHWQKVEKTPVYFIYLTTLVDKNGELIKFNNIYNYPLKTIRNLYK